MAAASLIVRPLSSPEEYAWQFHLSNQAFSDQPSPEGAQRWQHYLTNFPEFQPEQLRGAFQDDEYLGGYLIYERLLRMGAAAIPCTGYLAYPFQNQEVNSYAGNLYACAGYMGYPPDKLIVSLFRYLEL
jgi:hypothetical protein